MHFRFPFLSPLCPIPTLPPLLLPFLPFPSPLEVGHLKSSYGIWGSAVSSPAGPTLNLECILA